MSDRSEPLSPPPLLPPQPPPQQQQLQPQPIQQQSTAQLTAPQTYLPALSPAAATNARPAGASMSYFRPSGAEDWEPYREMITDLYANNTLAVVMEEVERRHGFRATLKQYKTMFKKWGLDKKYIKGTEYSAMVQTRRDRINASPPKDTAFTLRGQTVDSREIDRFEKRATRNGNLQGMLDDLEPVSELEWTTPSPKCPLSGEDATAFTDTTQE